MVIIKDSVPEKYNKFNQIFLSLAKLNFEIATKVERNKSKFYDLRWLFLTQNSMTWDDLFNPKFAGVLPQSGHGS